MKDRRFLGLLLMLLAVTFLFAMVSRQRIGELQQEFAEAEKVRLAELAAEEKAAEEEKQRRLDGQLEKALAASADPEQIFSFSKKEKNVVLIMLDRAIGIYFPYIMAEMPEVAKQFDGFTFYPNTCGFGKSTIFGSPAVYGGYEYTPEAMNARQDEKLVDKHNEALKVLPKIFSDDGYRVVLSDPTIAGYKWKPDLTVFDEIDNVKAYTFLSKANVEDGPLTQYQKFMMNYEYLKNLPEMTNNRALTGTYIAIDNEITHRFITLNWPDYEPSLNPRTGPRERVFSQDESIYLGTDNQLTHYHVNACAMKLLGEWFDYLRQLGVYDNTRIIVVADHGYRVEQFPELMYGGTCLLYYNPLLIFKDFDSNEPLRFDGQLMTNADVPTLLTDNLIENATNPYTGNVLSKMVYKEELHPFMGNNWDVANNIRNNDFGDYRFFVVKDNIFDRANWSTTKIYPPKE